MYFDSLINLVILLVSMNKLLRTLAIIGAAVVALLAVAVVVLLFRVDPDQYRSAIEEAVFDASGLQLNIAGDMSLSFRPYVSVSLSDVRLRNPERPQELASAALVDLRVDAAELLGGRMVVQELHAAGLHLNWYVDAEGNNWWMTERLRQRPATARSPDDDSDPLEIRIDFLSVDEGSVDIQNLQRAYQYSVRDLELNSQDSNVSGRPFSLQASFDLIDPTAPAPWSLTLSSENRVDLDAGDLDLTDIQLALTPALVQGNIQIRDLFGDPRWEGQLSTSEFPLDDLLANLQAAPNRQSGRVLPGMSADRRWLTRMQVSFNGDPGQAQITGLIATLGDMRLALDASLRYAEGLRPANLQFDIETGRLDLSPYETGPDQSLSNQPAPDQPAPNLITQSQPGLAQSPLPTATNLESDVADEPAADPESRSLFDLEIPASLWSNGNVQGTLSIESLFAYGMEFGRVNVFANVESGVLDLELQPTPLLDGTLNGTVRINSIPAQSEITATLFTDNLDTTELAFPILETGAVSGRLNLESRFSGTGNTLGEWLDSFGGASTFSITDNSIDVGVIKQVFSTIAAFSPTGEAIQQLPDVIRFSEFNGYAIFDDGLDNNQQVKLRLDNLDISGTGGIDLDAENFQYDLSFTVLGEPYVQTIPANERYHNVSWPVACGARFDDPVNQFCRPDLLQVREIFTQLGNSALQPTLDETIPEQTPEALQAPPRGLLDNLFRN